MATMNLRVLATAIWLYEETGSGVTLAGLGLIELAMRIPANLYGGALADEVDRKKLMAFTQMASFLLIASMAATNAVMSWGAFSLPPAIALERVSMTTSFTGIPDSPAA